MGTSKTRVLRGWYAAYTLIVVSLILSLLDATGVVHVAGWLLRASIGAYWGAIVSSFVLGVRARRRASAEPGQSWRVRDDRRP